MISFKAHTIANHGHLTVEIASMCSSVEEVHMHEKRHGLRLHVWSGDFLFYFFLMCCQIMHHFQISTGLFYNSWPETSSASVKVPQLI